MVGAGRGIHRLERRGHGRYGTTGLSTEPAQREVLASEDQRPTVIRQRYEQIADHLLADVRAGRLRPGDRLPTVSDFFIEEAAR